LPLRPKLVPVMCLNIGKMCANPCQRYKIEPVEGEIPYCRWHTAVEA